MIEFKSIINEGNPLRTGNGWNSLCNVRWKLGRRPFFVVDHKMVVVEGRSNPSSQVERIF